VIVGVGVSVCVGVGVIVTVDVGVRVLVIVGVGDSKGIEVRRVGSEIEPTE